MDIAELKVTRDGDSTTIVGTGELDLGIADDLSQALDSAIASGGDVVVDLRRASFIDTAILASIARAGADMVEKGSRLKVKVMPDTHPQYVLRIVGFAELMDIEVEDEATAGI